MHADRIEWAKQMLGTSELPEGLEECYDAVQNSIDRIQAGLMNPKEVGMVVGVFRYMQRELEEVRKAAAPKERKPDPLYTAENTLTHSVRKPRQDPDFQPSDTDWAQVPKGTKLVANWHKQLRAGVFYGLDVKPPGLLVRLNGHNAPRRILPNRVALASPPTNNKEE